MKKTLLFMVAALTLGATVASATTWRINPYLHAGSKFKTVAEAMANINVLPGDTLLRDPGSHGDIDARNREITIIGSGYLLDQNKQWSESQPTIVGNVMLSKNGKIEGCQSTGYISAGENSTVSRCYVAGSINTAQNCLIERCIFKQLSISADMFIVRNCIINYGSGSGYYEVPVTTGNSHGNGSIIENNVIIGSNTNYLFNDVRYCMIRNNIVINTREGFDNSQKPYAASIINFDGGNNSIQNNIFSTPAGFANKQYPNNLYVGATIDNTFVNEGSEDGRWQLIDNSAAKGAATHGGDCGAFDGSTPYILSGIPLYLPHITEASIPAKPTDGKITVKLKIANQNE